ncbi:MAG: GH3 auxin-responsive promoter family protein [Planctomycetaceae bacterium]
MVSIPLRNRLRSVIGSVFRRPIIRARDRYLQLARTSCREVQHETLRRLLQLNGDSDFSHRYGLQPGLSLSEFRSRLPVAGYETFRPWIERMQAGNHSALLGRKNHLLMYAVTSGTTAQPKLIPITDAFLSDYRRGWQHWGIAVHQQHSLLRQLRMVQITSSHDRWKTPDGTACGNISGLVTAMQKPIVRKLYTVPAAVSCIDDPAARRYAIARFAFADPWVGMLITANPATILQLIASASDSAETLIRDIHDGTLSPSADIPRTIREVLARHLKRSPERATQLQKILEQCGRLDPARCWKHLSVLGVWTGGSAGAYLPELRRVFGDLTIRDHGLHASEGRMTIPFHDNTAAGMLDIESHFFEFIPVEQIDQESPDVLEAHELQTARDYFILLTTSSGLYRYNIHDVVRCAGFEGTTPLLEFRHKGAHISSITGEKITESQVVESVRQASASHNALLKCFTMTPVWGDPPGYRLFVGCDDGTEQRIDLNQLALTADQLLRQRNCEYDEKRGTGRLADLQCQVIPDTAWQRFTQSRLQKSGGSQEQYKHPCLLPDADFENHFLKTSGLANPVKHDRN